MPQRDRQGRFLPQAPGAPPETVSERELLARLVWLLERLLWQSSGTVQRFPQYRQQLRQEATRDA